MGASQAVKVFKHRELADAADPSGVLNQLAEAYAEEHLRATVAVGDGFVDEVIAPDDTRTRVAGALDALARRRRRATDRVLARRGFSDGNGIPEGASWNPPSRAANPPWTVGDGSLVRR
jgi:hypothetical protein